LPAKQCPSAALRSQRAALRSQNLMRCGDTRTGYNIISGHSRPNVDVPDAPEPSDALAVHMEQEAIKAEAEEGNGAAA